MSLPPEAPDIEVVARAIDVAFIERIEDDPSTIALINLGKAGGCAGLGDDGTVVLRSPPKKSPLLGATSKS
jgi:hypothetical protein